MAALLYVLTALGLLTVVHRLIVQIDRGLGLALILLPLVITGRALLTGAVYAPVDLPYMSFPLRAMSQEAGLDDVHNPALSDLYAQIIPWKKAARDAWLGGEWPLWNPYQFAGDILAASSQPAPYDPLFLLSLLLPVAQSLTFLASMTLFLYGLWMFVWLRELGSSQRASLFGAVAWMFGSFVLFWLAWPMASTIAWLPLVLTGVRRVLSGGRRGTTLLTAAFTLMLLAGHPESAMHIVAIAGVVTLWQLAATRTLPLAKLGRLIAAGILALSLTAIYLLPIIEAIPQTAEHFQREQIYSKIPRSLPPSEAGALLATNFVPFLYGAEHEEQATASPTYIPPGTAYAGTIVFPLVLYGLWRSRRSDRWLFAGLFLAGLALGVDFPVAADLLAKFPLFDIAINNRLIFLALFSLAVLATLGLDAWIDASRRTELAIVYAAFAAILVVVVTILWSSMRQHGLSQEYLVEKSILLIVPLVLAALVVFLQGARKFAFVALLLLLIVQRALESGHIYPALPERAFYPPVPELQTLAAIENPYRIVGLDYTLTPATATMYGLEDVRGYQAMTLQRWRNTYTLWCTPQPVWFNLVEDLTQPFLSFLNVRYAIAAPGSPSPAGWTAVATSERMILLENQHFLERAFVPERVRLNLPDDEAMFEMALETDFSRRSWISQRSGERLWGELDNGSGRVVVRAASMKRRELNVSMEKSGWVVISETGWKGWKALLDGEPVPLHRANHAFLAVQVPRGEHEVTLVYWPRSFVIGAAISGLTMSTLLSWLLFRSWRRRRRREKFTRLPVA